jgi:biotin transport system substrate-specific component
MLISYLWRRSSRGLTAAVASAALGNLVILLSGFVWLSAYTHASAKSAFTLAVIPFLPGDALKVVAAAALANGFRRIRRRA